MKRFQTVEEYISAVPAEVKHHLLRLRNSIRQAAPKAEEMIHYNMPAFKWKGMLVWYAAHKGHVGLYPRASAMTAFKDELKGYKTSKGAIQFPIEKAIPTKLSQRDC